MHIIMAIRELLVEVFYFRRLGECKPMDMCRCMVGLLVCESDIHNGRNRMSRDIQIRERLAYFILCA